MRLPREGLAYLVQWRKGSTQKQIVQRKRNFGKRKGTSLFPSWISGVKVKWDSYPRIPDNIPIRFTTLIKLNKMGKHDPHIIG